MKKQNSSNKCKNWLGRILNELRNRIDALLNWLEKASTVKMDDEIVGHMPSRNPLFMPVKHETSDGKIDQDDVTYRLDDEH